MPVDMYMCIGMCFKTSITICIIYILAWASALPSDFDRAMREASSSRTVTDTDSYAFFI